MEQKTNVGSGPQILGTSLLRRRNSIPRHRGLRTPFGLLDRSHWLWRFRTHGHPIRKGNGLQSHWHRYHGGSTRAKSCGADHVLNSMSDKEYKKKIIEITGGGVHAAVNFTASKKSYDDCPAIVKAGEGMIMVVGIPRQPLEFNGLDIALGRYKIKGSNNGSKLRNSD
jgi:hypothetical protein